MGGQRPRETRGGGRTGRQADRALRWKGTPSAAGAGGAPAGRQALVRGHQGGRADEPLRSPAALPAALLLEPGPRGGFSASRDLGAPSCENTLNSFPFCLASPARLQLGSPKPSRPRKSQQREGGRVGHRMTRGRQAEPRASESQVRETGREGRGWGGGTSQMGQDSRWGHRHAPTLPWGQPKAQFLCPALPWGPRSWELPPAAQWVGGTWGRKGAVRLLSCKANPALVGPVRCACVGGIPHTDCPLPHTPVPTRTSTGVTPASEAQGRMAAQAAPLQARRPWPLRNLTSLALLPPLEGQAEFGGAASGSLSSAAPRAWHTDVLSEQTWGTGARLPVLWPSFRHPANSSSLLGRGASQPPRCQSGHTPAEPQTHPACEREHCLLRAQGLPPRAVLPSIPRALGLASQAPAHTRRPTPGGLWALPSPGPLSPAPLPARRPLASDCTWTRGVFLPFSSPASGGTGFSSSPVVSLTFDYQQQ